MRDTGDIYCEIREKENNYKNKFILIILLIFMKIIDNVLGNFYDLTTKNLIELDIDILTLFLINNLCFEKNIYSHQLISIIINIIILIFCFCFKSKIIIHKMILYILSSYMHSFYFY